VLERKTVYTALPFLFTIFRTKVLIFRGGTGLRHETDSVGIFEEAAKLIPDYPRKKSSAVRERSAMNWPEKVNAPLLILHGGDDDEVPATEALAFATKLSNLKKPYELVVYANDIHEVANNRRDRDARVIAWFKRYLR
jgi:dipeptidyl aminopeptidase/acylaminoacyl peptidase